MHTVSQMDRNLYIRARQKQADLWDHIIATLSGGWHRGWSRDWPVDPRISPEEVMQDLQFGRD
jgi:hypothetical protein